MADWLDDVVMPRESGGRPNIGWKNTDLTPYLDAGKTVHGFPDWPGLPGPDGISTAAGLYGITKTNWRNYAPGLGVNDFSPASQRKVADAIMADQGPRAWAASGPVEGVYGGATHVNIPAPPRPQDPFPAALMLDSLLAGQPIDQDYGGAQAEGSPDHLLDMLLQPRQWSQASGGGGGQSDALEPPSATPAPPSAAAASLLAQAEPLAAAPITGAGDALDRLLATPSADGGYIEPPGLGSTETPTNSDKLQQTPTQPPGAPPAQTGMGLLDSLLDQFRQATVEPMAREVPAALGDIGRMLGGLGERAELAEEAIGTGQPMREPQVPVRPGVERLSDIATFATGGLMSPLSVPREAAAAAALPAREAAAATPRVLGDVRGGKPPDNVTPFPPSGRQIPFDTSAGPPVGGPSMPRVPEIEPNPGGGFDIHTNGPAGVLYAETREAAERLAAEHGLVGANDAGGGPPRQPPHGPPAEPPSGGGKPPLLDPPVPGEGLKQIANRVDDALHRILNNNTADKIEAARWYRSLPRRWKDRDLQARIADDVERRMIDPTAPLSPEAEGFVSGPAAKLAAEENRLGRELQELLGPDAAAADLPTAWQGYVHRVVENPRTGKPEETLGTLDPERGRTSDVITGAGRSLSKFASGMQHRAPRFVLQDAAGNRVFNKQRLDEAGYSYGQKVPGADGKEWTVKPPTMAEMEANTPVRYVHDYVGSLMANVLRLRRIKRNAELLRDLKSELSGKGLFHEDRRMIGREGAVEQWVNLGQHPPELSGEVNLPQLRGWTDPKIANVLNDFWNASGGDLDRALGKINRFLIGWMFATPVPHALNVGAHWATGRGWDWLSLPAYVRGARAGGRAINAVWNLGPEYVRMLREGSGILYGDTAMENFYNTLMKKVWTEQLRDPEAWAGYARQVLNKPFKTPLEAVRALVNAEYRWSRKTLWAVNDMLMLQRVFELEARGIPTREAIRQTEKDIPNYRVPSEVMGSHAFASALKSPNWMNFGRYKYGQVNALGQMMKDLVSPKASGRERWEAAGKLTMLGTIATLGYPALDALLKGIGSQMGADSENWRARRSGPYALIDAMRGLVEGDKEFAAAMSSLITPAPVIEGTNEFLTQHDWFGRPLVDPRSSGVGMAVQAGEAVANQFYPTQLGLRAASQGPGAVGNLVGLDLRDKPAGPSPKLDKMLRGRARARERKDPVENWIRERLPAGLQ